MRTSPVYFRHNRSQRQGLTLKPAPDLRPAFIVVMEYDHISDISHLHPLRDKPFCKLHIF